MPRRVRRPVTGEEGTCPQPQRAVVVPIANPAIVSPLLALRPARGRRRDAGARDGGPAERSRDVTWRSPRAASRSPKRSRRPGGAGEGRVVEADELAAGVLAAAAEEGPTSLMVMGWRGQSSTTNVFGRLLDTHRRPLGAPLAVVRMGKVPFRRVLLPVSADHLLPAGDRGLGLAVRLADRLHAVTPEPRPYCAPVPVRSTCPPTSSDPGTGCTTTRAAPTRRSAPSHDPRTSSWPRWPRPCPGCAPRRPISPGLRRTPRCSWPSMSDPPARRASPTRSTQRATPPRRPAVGPAIGRSR